MPVLESYIERRATQYVRARNGLVLKIQLKKGWPDRLFITSGGTVMFIEFKAQGRKASPLQLHILEKLWKQGCNALLTDNYEEFKEFYDTLDIPAE